MTDKKHYLRPLKGKITANRHLFLWIGADERAPILKARSRRAWEIELHGRELSLAAPQCWHNASQIDDIIDRATAAKGKLTIWLARGWEDLVLSGLAQMMDLGVICWRYCLLDGQRVLVRGLWRGRPIVITSLANWLAPRWNSTSCALEDAACRRSLDAFAASLQPGDPHIVGDERQALATWCALANLASTLCAPRLCPTVASQALLTWRQWLGPRVQVERSRLGLKARKRGAKLTPIVAPVPFRPEKAAAAERHVCYGLTTKHLRAGHVDEEVYLVDLRSAYALALVTTRLPVLYSRTLHRPSADELAKAMLNRTGHALIRITTADWAYPVRRGRRVQLATGNFWTWLAGAELAHALCQGHVAHVEKAYLWFAAHLEDAKRLPLLTMAESLNEAGCPGLAAAWRALYAALVGQFAGRRHVWTDMPAQPDCERWCQYVKADCHSSILEHCRAIAGRHQRLAATADTSRSVPLMFGCITAQVRWFMQRLADLAGLDAVVAVLSDALMVTRDGWQQLLKHVSAMGLAADNLRTKGVYDRVWLNGKSAMVLERKGRRWLHMPGCDHDAELDAAGNVSTLAAANWTDTAALNPAHGLPRRRRRFAGQKIIDDNSFAARPVPFGEPLDDPIVRAELLEPPQYGRSVLDE